MPHGLMSSQSYKVNQYFILAEIDRQTGGPLSKPRMQRAGLFGWFASLFSKKATSPESVYDGWELTQKRNQYLFTFYVLIYLFYQDDGEFTEAEQQLIRQLIKKTKGIFTPDDYQKIVDFSQIQITIDDVSTYIKEHKLPETFIKQSMNDIHEFLSKHQEYSPFLQDLEKQLY